MWTSGGGAEGSEVVRGRGIRGAGKATPPGLMPSGQRPAHPSPPSALPPSPSPTHLPLSPTHGPLTQIAELEQLQEYHANKAHRLRDQIGRSRGMSGEGPSPGAYPPPPRQDRPSNASPPTQKPKPRPKGLPVWTAGLGGGGGRSTTPPGPEGPSAALQWSCGRCIVWCSARPLRWSRVGGGPGVH